MGHAPTPRADVRRPENPLWRNTVRADTRVMTAPSTPRTTTTAVRPADGRGDVVVRPLAVHDDAEAAAAHAAVSASRSHERPWAKQLSLRELTVDLRTPSSVERLEPWVA